ncbi:MAG TPA: glycosyltransferase family 39 protein [Tepidisphaeraceae bacterium]|nr:glycosyltransferase family 39 protein [Tepidisphaeraceae bacterium]
MENSQATPLPPSSTSLTRFWFICAALAALVFVAIAPTLRWLEFSNSAEALNVATAQEILRSGNWLVPTLQGEVRTAKPPLTAWITAISISGQTMQDISSPDSSVRNAAFVSLAWQTRWPALLAACLALLLTAELGRLLAGPKVGIVSLIAAATSLLFLRFSRYSTTDIWLTLWVIAANVGLLHAIFHQRHWTGFVSTGAALGLAMMTKGPVSLLQTLLPIAAMYPWLRMQVAFSVLVAPTDGQPQPVNTPTIQPKTFKAVAAALAVFVVVGLSWFIYMLVRDRSIASIWFREVTREGARDVPASHWHSYFSLIPYLMPWSLFAVAGAIVAVRERLPRMILAVVMVLVPVVVMSFARDRNERYLLPMIPAAAVLAGIGYEALKQSRPLLMLHAFGLAAIAVGFPLVTLFLKPAWYTPLEAITTAVAAALIIERGFWPARREKQTPLATTFIVMLAIQAFFILGYRNTRQGRAELKPLAEQIADRFPTAEIYNAHPRGKRPPPELGVYLNRVLRWTDDPASITRSSASKILLMLQNKNDPDPTPPPSWNRVMKLQRDQDWWWAFELPADR